MARKKSLKNLRIDVSNNHSTLKKNRRVIRVPFLRARRLGFRSRRRNLWRWPMHLLRISFLRLTKMKPHQLKTSLQKYLKDSTARMNIWMKMRPIQIWLLPPYKQICNIRSFFIISRWKMLSKGANKTNNKFMRPQTSSITWWNRVSLNPLIVSLAITLI